MMYHNKNGTSRATCLARWCHIRLQSPLREALWFIAILALMLLAACTSASPTTPPASTPTASPTIGQLASAGESVFAAKCAGCHGDKGQGATAPAIIGANAGLRKYNTAQGLLDFISSSMPINAPGSLSQQQYQQVLSFLLVQNKFAPPDSAFAQSELKNIALK